MNRRDLIKGLALAPVAVIAGKAISSEAPSLRGDRELVHRNPKYEDRMFVGDVVTTKHLSGLGNSRFVLAKPTDRIVGVITKVAGDTMTVLFI